MGTAPQVTFVPPAATQPPPAQATAMGLSAAPLPLALSGLILDTGQTGEGAPVVTMGLVGYPSAIDGVPCYYRKMRLCDFGNWTHRGSGEPVVLTRERAEEWLRNTKSLALAGVEPFMPNYHVGGELPRGRKPGADYTNYGYWIDFGMDDTGLFGVAQLIGDDSREAAAKLRRSLYVVNDARDARGKVHKGESIAHVALVANPALPNLGHPVPADSLPNGGLVRIAASADAAAVEVPVYVPAGAVPERPAEPSPPAVLPRFEAGAFAALALAGDDEGEWRTIRGVHVHIGKGGVIDKGPKSMVGRKPDAGEGKFKLATDRGFHYGVDAAKLGPKVGTTTEGHDVHRDANGNHFAKAASGAVAVREGPSSAEVKSAHDAEVRGAAAKGELAKHAKGTPEREIAKGLQNGHVNRLTHATDTAEGRAAYEKVSGVKLPEDKGLRKAAIEHHAGKVDAAKLHDPELAAKVNAKIGEKVQGRAVRGDVKEALASGDHAKVAAAIAKSPAHLAEMKRQILAGGCGKGTALAADLMAMVGAAEDRQYGPFAALALAAEAGPPDYYRDIDGHAVAFWGAPGHGYTESQAVRLHATRGTKTVTVESKGDGTHRVTESGPGSGQHTHTDHPTPDAAAADANARVRAAESAAKAGGSHVATLQRVPGPMPANHARYSVRETEGEGGAKAAYLIDHKSGDVKAPAGKLARHYDDAAEAHAVAARLNAREAARTPEGKADESAAADIEANAAAARARVEARKAVPAANPTVMTGYHGSPHKFDEFRVTPGATESKWGPGVYFDPDKQGALDFVRNGASEGTPHHLYTAKVTLNKPYEADGPIKDEHFDAINKAAGEMGKQGIPEEFRRNSARTAYKVLVARNGYDNSAANQILRRAGFDGVKDTNEFVAFDPKAARIQSVRSFGGGAATPTPSPSPAGLHTVEETPAGHVVRSPEGKIVDGPTSRHKAERIAGELDDMRSGAIQRQTMPDHAALPGGIGGISRDVPGKPGAYDAAPSVNARAKEIGERMAAGPVKIHTSGGTHEYGVARHGGGYRDYALHPGGNKVIGKLVDTEAGARTVAAMKAAYAERAAVESGTHVRTSVKRKVALSADYGPFAVLALDDRGIKGEVYFRTIEGHAVALKGTDPDPKESARWKAARAKHIEQAMKDRGAKTVHVATADGDHVVSAVQNRVHHTDAAGETHTTFHDNDRAARSAAAEKAAHLEHDAHAKGDTPHTQSAVAIDEETAAAVKHGKLIVPTEGGEVDPGLADAYRRHAEKLGYEVGEFKYDKTTNTATATLVKKGGEAKAPAPKAEAKSAPAAPAPAMKSKAGAEAAKTPAAKPDPVKAVQEVRNVLRTAGNGADIEGETANGTKIKLTGSAFGRLTPDGLHVMAKDLDTEVPLAVLRRVRVNGKVAWEHAGAKGSAAAGQSEDYRQGFESARKGMAAPDRVAAAKNNPAAYAKSIKPHLDAMTPEGRRGVMDYMRANHPELHAALGGGSPADGIPFSADLPPFAALALSAVSLKPFSPGGFAALALAAYDGPVHWITKDGEHIPIKGAPGGKADLRRTVSHREYDRIHGPGAAAKAIAESGRPAVEAGKAAGENGGMETHEWTTERGSKIELSHEGGKLSSFKVNGTPMQAATVEETPERGKHIDYYDPQKARPMWTPLPAELHGKLAAEPPRATAEPVEAPPAKERHKIGRGVQSKTMYVHGDTYAQKDELKKIGATWDRDAGAWKLQTGIGTAQAEKRIAAMGLKLKEKPPIRPPKRPQPVGGDKEQLSYDMLRKRGYSHQDAMDESFDG